MFHTAIKDPQPAKNPIRASQEIFFTYQKKSIFSIPIAATPAAEPMMSKLPPVPAEKAIKCHREASNGSWNIPIAAATSGTLSITAEAKPRIIITIFSFGIT